MKNISNIPGLLPLAAALTRLPLSRLAAVFAALVFAVLSLIASDGASAQVSTRTLMLSLSPDRSSPVPLDGETVAGNIFVFTTPDTGVSRVDFFLDDPSMTGLPAKVENNAPFDFRGTNSNGTAIAFDTNSLSSGTHNVTARFTLTAGGTETASADFTTATEGLSEPDQVHLAWVDEPSMTLTVVWRTLETSTPSQVQYRPAGSSTWTTVTGSPRSSGTAGTLHQVTLTGLSPDSAYEYRVARDNGGWSTAIYSARTAPAPGPADFDLIFVADTGIVGRTDGLTTGTQQVIGEITALEPDFVLLGGDYAYFDTDKRFITLERTIDAWFNQVQPFASIAPLMPTYGNHEISQSLNESFAPWAARFPTPDGFDGRRLYSFDVGDAHFISITAWADFGSLPSSYITWIQQDIQAARDAGKTWIVPYFHVSPFADGMNHPSNTNLRSQLGPIFEAAGIDLVLTAHDQAYERTYPLSGIGSTNTPTTTELDCYTKSEGVTFAKVSPGGKLSNKNDDFSQFATNPAPSWTAVRNNTLHNFARLTFSAEGTMRLEVFGVVGDGTPPVIIDEFEYRTSACDGSTASLQATPGSLSFTHVQGNPAPATQTATLSASGGSAANVSISVSPQSSWLTVTPVSGSTPLELQVSVNPAGLAPGTYNSTITASAVGFANETLPVSLTVSGSGTGPGYSVLYSASANRSSAVPLSGATVSGLIYAFTSPDTNVDRVQFWLDNPSMSGAPVQTENNPPNDFKGTASNGSALPFDTTSLTNGAHEITARLTFFGGATQVVSSAFQVNNGGGGGGTTYSLVMSTSASRSAPTALQGATVSGNIYVFTTPDTGVTRVQFWLDNPAMSGTPAQTENGAPYDFEGTASNGQASPFNTATLTNGSHSITARLTLSNGTTQAVSGVFQVNNGGGGGGTTYSLIMSTSANRSAPTALQGATVSGNIYVFTTPDTNVTRVQFWLDNPAMSGTPVQTENSGPYDFEGTASNGTALPFNTTTVTNGSHEITARVTLSNGTTQVVSGVFQVNNNS